MASGHNELGLMDRQHAQHQEISATSEISETHSAESKERIDPGPKLKYLKAKNQHVVPRPVDKGSATVNCTFVSVITDDVY